MTTPEASAADGERLLPIDWMRGLVMVLMTVDHSSDAFNAGRLFSDAAFLYKPGTPLPAGQFLTRFLTHLCAPTFVFLAGASLALMVRRRARAGDAAWVIDRQVLLRGLFIALLDPLWMSLAFMGGQRILLQVLYAIGGSMMAMTLLRRLPPLWLAIGAPLILVGVELVLAPGLEAAVPGAGRGAPPPLLVGLLLSGGGYGWLVIGYPLLSWLAIMMLGFAFGQWVGRRGGELPAAALAVGGGLLLSLFVLLRGLDGFGNLALHRGDGSLVQWLHVAKYPPSITFAALELGLMALLLSAFCLLARGGERFWTRPLSVYGSTAMFFYLLHLHLMLLAALLLGVHQRLGLLAAWLGAGGCLLALYLPCARYRAYKRTHQNLLTRFI